MFCGKCGAKMTEDAVFCSECGNKMAFAAPPVEEPVAPPVTEAPAQVETPPLEPTPEMPPVEQQPFTSPVQEPAAPLEEAYALPVQDFYVPPVMPQDMPESKPPKPKRSKKKIVFTILGIVLALVLVAAALLYILVFNSPKYKIKKALKNNLNELGEIVGNAENLGQMFENLEAIGDDYTVNFSMDNTIAGTYEYDDGYSYEENTQLDLSIDYSLTDRQMNFAINYQDDYRSIWGDGDINEGGNSVALNLYADDSRLVLYAPELLDDAYYVPLPDIGEALADSALLESLGANGELLRDLRLDLFSNSNGVTWEQFLEANDGVEDEFLDSLEIEESNRRISGADRGLAVYSIEADWEEGIDLILEYMYYSVKQSGMGDQFSRRDFRYTGDDIELEIFVGIDDDDRLAALELVPEDEDSVTLLFNGKDNLWDEVEILVDDRTMLTWSVKKTEGGFSITGDDGKEALEIICNDTDGKLEVFFDGESLFSLNYGCADDGMQISWAMEDVGNDFAGDYTEKIRIELEVLPVEKIEAPDVEPVALLDMTKEELEELFGTHKEAGTIPVIPT